MKSFFRLFLALLVIVNVLFIVIFIYISINKFLYVYRVSAFVIVSSSIAIICLIMLIKASTCKERPIFIVTVNCIITLLSMIGFIYFMPLFTINEAIDKIRSDSQYAHSLSIQVNNEIPSIQSHSKTNLFVDSVYRIDVVGEEKCIILFDPVTGKYYVEK